MISFQETINKLGEEIRALNKENAKLQIVVIENENLKKLVAKLEDKIQETDGCLNKVEFKEALKEEKLGGM